MEEEMISADGMGEGMIGGVAIIEERLNENGNVVGARS
jgi:hypothetical protein